ncbi:MAG: sulfatase [Pirellulaceae bacterium]|jgi:arylsulfatase A-like enzyme|nr:sulfatase [Pirellulaceae bacterium]
MRTLLQTVATLLALLTLSCSASGAAADAAGRPNVLFFAVDDLRPEFGAYGKTYIHSPNLDRLANRGMTFNRAYCQQAVCSPTRSSLLTGTRPDTTKVWDLETHFRTALPDVVTLPQHFKQNGYFVQGMGKLYHGGFDDPQSWSVPWTSPKTGHGTYGLPENNALSKQASAATPKNAPKAKKGKAASRGPRGPAFESSDVPDNTFHDGALADMAVAALAECAKKDQPFWLGVGFIRPHLPFVAPKKYWDLYDPATIQLAPNPFPPKGAPEYAVLPGGELRSYHGIPTGPIPDDLARQLKHGYFAAISYMDAQVGRVLDELDRLGLTEKTIIVLWGDHGWKLGEHGGWCKHSNVENDTNAPLLISVPGLKTAGQRTNSLAEFVDIYPTLAELCGLPLPEHLEGASLVPVLRDPTTAVKSAAFSQYPRGVDGRQLMGYTMRTDRYRFTRWVGRSDHSKVDAVELYDHQTDPQENVNIANSPENAELVARLTEQWQQGWRGAMMTRE